MLSHTRAHPPTQRHRAAGDDRHLRGNYAPIEGSIVISCSSSLRPGTSHALQPAIRARSRQLQLWSLARPLTALLPSHSDNFAPRARLQLKRPHTHAAARAARSSTDAQKVIRGRPIDPLQPPSSTSLISHSACSRVRAQDGPRRRQAVAYSPGSERRPRGGRRCAAAGRPQRPSGSRFCRFRWESAIFAPWCSPCMCRVGCF